MDQELQTFRDAAFESKLAAAEREAQEAALMAVRLSDRRESLEDLATEEAGKSGLRKRMLEGAMQSDHPHWDLHKAVTELVRRDLHDMHKESTKADKTWDFESTMAYWASVLFIQGAVLFTMGSIGLYPSILGNLTHEVREAWIDYNFAIGAWLFFIGNYILYFQVINQGHTHAPTDRLIKGKKFIACPELEYGHLGAFFNTIGAVLFLFNTSFHYHICYWLEVDLKRPLHFNIWYVGTGAVGSVCFILGSICEGEHNHWRSCSWETLRSLPVIMSHLNLWGGILFLVGYLASISHWDGDLCQHGTGDCTLRVWGVASTFTVGSVCFVLSSWGMLWMWKTANFGLSFAKKLEWETHPERRVDLKQQIMIGMYIANICMNWLRLGLLQLDPVEKDVKNIFGLEVGFKLMAYHCILFLTSTIHRAPDRHPYDYLLISMRFICFYGFFSEVYVSSILTCGYLEMHDTSELEGNHTLWEAQDI